MGNDSVEDAIHEHVRNVPYDPDWPNQFLQERTRLSALFSELGKIEHIGSTAVPGLSAKPVIDILATVPSMQVADRLIPKLCENGYVTSAEFNSTLPDRRWLMRHAAGRRTHHLHLVLPNSSQWTSSLRFRDMLRDDSTLAANYAAKKQSLAQSLAMDREAYTAAKSDFIERALRLGENPST